MSFQIIALFHFEKLLSVFFTGYACERCKEQDICIEGLIGKETQNLECFYGAGSRFPESDPPGDRRLSNLFPQGVHLHDA